MQHFDELNLFANSSDFSRQKTKFVFQTNFKVPFKIAAFFSRQNTWFSFGLVCRLLLKAHYTFLAKRGNEIQFPAKTLKIFLDVSAPSKACVKSLRSERYRSGFHVAFQSELMFKELSRSLFYKYARKNYIARKNTGGPDVVCDLHTWQYRVTIL